MRKKFPLSTAKTSCPVYSFLLVPGDTSKEITAPCTERVRLINCYSCPWSHLCYKHTKSTFSQATPKDSIGSLKRDHGLSFQSKSLPIQFGPLPTPAAHFIHSPATLRWFHKSPCSQIGYFTNSQELQGSLVQHPLPTVEGSTSQSDDPSSATAQSFLAWNPSMDPHVESTL